MSDDWMLDEVAHAGADHLDDAFVAGYDRKQGAEPDRAAAEDLEILRRHGIGDDATVLDLGAGSGRFAAHLAPNVGQLVAVELSPAMRRRMRDRLHEAGLRPPRVEVVAAGVLSYERPDASADAVHTRNMLHQLPDAFKALALHRMARWLRPGGLLRLRDLVYDATPAELPDLLARWFAAAPEDPADGYTAADLAEHVRTEHSTFTWLLEPMLDAAGFEIVERDTTGRTFAAYTCRRR